MHFAPVADQAQIGEPVLYRTGLNTSQAVDLCTIRYIQEFS